ncbi:hypothetical protein P389DRAFT_212946 [Cystobasidium minutum MCA 4210]|uniref:uncharacterized protein n=1 Tax=Cystobasidium minutum MCA 4210 TaxID=1397322 RepID=UPI0034CE1DAF|eukprot:jgi/Rhomi1/212946/estExt_Genemark1.C_80166
MFVYIVFHKSVEPEGEWPTGEFTETIGIYTTFDAACDAARAGLGRARKDYAYYKESRADDDDESVYSEQSHDDEVEARDTEKVWVKKTLVQSDFLPVAQRSQTATTADTSATTMSESKVEDVKMREHTDPDIDDAPGQAEILGSYRTFSEARQAAREGLLRDAEDDEYFLYVEGKVGDENEYEHAEKSVRIIRNDEEDDARGDTEFCIYTWHEHGDSERIWVEEGTLHAVQTVSSGSSNGSKSADQSFQEQHEASSTELSIKKGQKRSSPTGDVKGTNSASNKRSKHDIEIASDTEEELGD